MTYLFAAQLIGIDYIPVTTEDDSNLSYPKDLSHRFVIPVGPICQHGAIYWTVGINWSLLPPCTTVEWFLFLLVFAIPTLHVSSIFSSQ